MSTLRTAARIALGRTSPTPESSTAPATDTRATEYLGLLGAYGTFGAPGTIDVPASERDFSASAVAYRCMDFIASNLASVDLMVLAGEEPDEHDPVATIWNRGGDGAPLSARVVRQIAWHRAELTGESFTFIDRGPTGDGEVRGFHPIFDQVEVVTRWDERGLYESVVGYVVRRNGKRIPLLASEVLWLRYPHPTKRWGSLAPWRAALYANETDAYARAWQRGEFRNAARPSSIIHLGEQDETSHERAVAAYNSRVAGPGNAGRSLIVSGPGKANVLPLSLTPAEMSFLETRARSAEEVMLAFGLRSDVLTGQSTYENQRAAKTSAWSETLLPKLDVAGSEIDHQLIPDLGRTAAWDLTNIEALRESQDAVIKRAADSTNPDIALIDEARAMIGFDPLPNGAGQMTQTPYRERARADAAIMAAQALGGARVGTPAQVRYVRVGGVSRFVRLTRERIELDERVKPRTVQQTLRAYDRHERVGVRAIERLAARQVKDVLRKFRDLTRGGELDLTTATAWAQYAATQPEQQPVDGAPERATQTADTGQRMAADDLLNVTYWTDETVRALEDFMSGAWLEGGEYAAGLFGLSFDVFDDRVLDAMSDRLRVLAGRITETTRAILDSQLLQHGAAAGESIDDLAARLRGTFDDLSGWRARMIARTEVVGGMNASAHTVAIASGLVVRRTWIATDDERTRPSHVRQDGVTLRGTDATYPNGCRYPGDPAAPASETIQCRCVELFETE